MNLSLFVQRPVFTGVLMCLMALLGILALRDLDVRELPSIERPVLTVTADWPGAGSEQVERELTIPLENALTRVDGVTSLASTSRFGRTQIRVDLAPGVSAREAAQAAADTTSRLNLPTGVSNLRVVRADTDAQPILRIGLMSDTLTVRELSAIARESLLSAYLTLDGVADVTVFGEQEDTLRVIYHPDKLAARDLTPQDLVNALTARNRTLTTGVVEDNGRRTNTVFPPEANTLETLSNVLLQDTTPFDEHAHLQRAGSVTETRLLINGQSALGLGLVATPGSNALTISSQARALTQTLQDTWGDQITFLITNDDALFIRSALIEMLKTLLLAIGVVGALIWLFLKDLKLTLVPTLTIPLALLGTLVGLWFLGFSLNILTLLAFVLATGLVVDDTIVVMENIERRQRLQPQAPRVQTVVDATREVFFAVVSTTVTLVAVFLPLSFFPGQVGALFGEFGISLAVAVSVSSVTALTLCPMLMALHKPTAKASAPQTRSSPIDKAYTWLLKHSLRNPLVVSSVVAGGTTLAVMGWPRLTQEIVPPEDRGVVLMSLRGPAGIDRDAMATLLTPLEEQARNLIDTGDAVSLFQVVGTQGGNGAFLILTLTPWDMRERSQAEILTQINRSLATLPELTGFAFSPNSLGLRGGGQGLQVAVTGGQDTAREEALDTLVQRLQQIPSMGRVQRQGAGVTPERVFETSPEQMETLGLSQDTVANTIRLLLTGPTGTQIFLDDATDLRLDLDPVNGRNTEALLNTWISTQDGPITLQEILTVSERPSPAERVRENRQGAVALSASLDGIALGQAISLLEDTWNTVENREGMSLLLRGESAALMEGQQQLLWILALTALCVVLVLAAQFESWTAGWAILSTVPLGMAVGVFAMGITGTSVNAYSQIGFVILMGLMAKNAILIVDFAQKRHLAGMERDEAILEACSTRFRAIVMTLLSTVLGAVPLILSTGAGAEAREALGWVIVGGLGLSTLSTLFVTPVALSLLWPKHAHTSTNRENPDPTNTQI